MKTIILIICMLFTSLLILSPSITVRKLAESGERTFWWPSRGSQEGYNFMRTARQSRAYSKCIYSESETEAHQVYSR
ncbi:hypothetical protein CIPAW_03G021900 [Carya illinoinensis]|uniref:Uncharacterized protein n=1 Tax=Carya illinoinensis TaxID=32201 RepID=A0A8T1QZC4_CARIL|nr:hypothetical protein CIPAW_03G021900 [Carya illinoinensis]